MFFCEWGYLHSVVMLSLSHLIKGNRKHHNVHFSRVIPQTSFCHLYSFNHPEISLRKWNAECPNHVLCSTMNFRIFNAQCNSICFLCLFSHYNSIAFLKLIFFSEDNLIYKLISKQKIVLFSYPNLLFNISTLHITNYYNCANLKQICKMRRFWHWC